MMASRLRSAAPSHLLAKPVDLPLPAPHRGEQALTGGGAERLRRARLAFAVPGWPFGLMMTRWVDPEIAVPLTP